MIALCICCGSGVDVPAGYDPKVVFAVRACSTCGSFDLVISSMLRSREDFVKFARVRPTVVCSDQVFDWAKHGC